MLPNGFSSNPLNGLFSTQNEGSSIFGSADATFNASQDLSQPLRPLCLQQNIVNSSPNLNIGLEDRSRTNLIINYLPQSFDQVDLQRLFERLGPIRQCKLIRDKNTGASLCYGFVDYMNPQHAQLAISTYHGFETEGKRLRVAFACSGGRKYASGRSNDVSPESNIENIIGWELYVFGFPIEISEAELVNLFSCFGSVLNVRVLTAADLQRLPPSVSSIMADVISNVTDGVFGTGAQPRFKTVSVILEEKQSCDVAVTRLHGIAVGDGSLSLRVHIAGPVTRETCTMMILNSRQNLGPVGGPSRSTPFLPNVLSERISSLGISSNSHRAQPLRIFNPNESNENSIPLSSHNRSLARSRAAGILSIAENPDFSDIFEGHMPSGQSRSFVDSLATKVESNILERSGLALNKGESSIWSSSGASSAIDLYRNSRQLDALLPRRLSIITPTVNSSYLSYALSQTGGRGVVELKLEFLQPTGSVALRAMDFVVRKLVSQGAQHIVCPTTGNAGVAAAVVAQNHNIACTVVTPESDTFTKKRLSVEAPLAKLVASGSSFADAVHRAEQIVSEANQPFSAVGDPIPVKLVHPYETPDLWCGYESIVEELTTQPDVIVTPVGGGALLSGVIQSLWNRGWTSTHVIAMEPEGCDRLGRAVGSLRPITNVSGPTSTVISTLSVSAPLPRAVNVCQCYPITIMSCTDAEAIDAVRRFLDDHGVLLDPASGVALAAIYNGSVARLQSEGVIPRLARVCILVTGGRNISVQHLTELEKTVKTSQVVNGTRSFGFSQTQPFFAAESLLADLDNDGDDTTMDSRTASSSTDANSVNSKLDNGGEEHTSNQAHEFGVSSTRDTRRILAAHSSTPRGYRASVAS
uniref:L-serine ammonia-lyase n=1 Tax=Echinococcus canadensis TaxID=519352 RepID=A0A915EXU3_9CEST